MTRLYATAILSWCWLAAGFYYYSEGNVLFSAIFFYLGLYSRHAMYRKTREKQKTAFYAHLFLLVTLLVIFAYILLDWNHLMHKGRTINKWFVNHFYCIFIPCCLILLYKDYKRLSKAAHSHIKSVSRKQDRFKANKPSRKSFIFKWTFYQSGVFAFCYLLYEGIGWRLTFGFLELGVIFFGLPLGIVQWYILRDYTRIGTGWIFLNTWAWIAAAYFSNLILHITGGTCCSFFEYCFIGGSEHYCMEFTYLFFVLFGTILGIFHILYFSRLSRSTFFYLIAYPAGISLAHLYVLMVPFPDFIMWGSFSYLTTYMSLVFLIPGLALVKNLEFNQFKFCPLNGYVFPRHSGT